MSTEAHFTVAFLFKVDFVVPSFSAVSTLFTYNIPDYLFYIGRCFLLVGTTTLLILLLD